ncbi:MAG: hypothetical protein KatS3mg043_1375 [Rhodothermaceae bacterium]|nr:MAG: hypothetical protein KatS3mg043_1375 [Rhodothermaceae bacterium]
MTHRPIQKVLIANRGEIAVRVIRTCRELGLATVAVFSEPDRTAPHVRLADEAYLLGPAPSAQSYLVQEKILEVARRSGADAVHPGYGFLSENADFAEACAAAGLVFIGPPPAAIRAMGDKTAARRLMEKAGVPMAPGTTDAIDDPDEAARIAEAIGYPVLIKAAAGGGGKGMRIVETPSEFRRTMEAARREAQAAFGDGRVYIEKYIVEPRAHRGPDPGRRARQRGRTCSSASAPSSGATRRSSRRRPPRSSRPRCAQRMGEAAVSSPSRRLRQRRHR